MSGHSLTDEEVWDKLSSFVAGEIEDVNNNDDCDMTQTAHLGERHCASNHSSTETTLLGKRHSTKDQSTAAATVSKRHCADLEERHSADNQTTLLDEQNSADLLAIETTLLGERHSANHRGINVFGADPSNTSLRTVFRSLSSGIIANLRSMSPASQHLAGLRRIIGSGGALVRNSVMCKAVRDLYNLPLVINGKSDTGDSAVGAAIAAGRFL